MTGRAMVLPPASNFRLVAPNAPSQLSFGHSAGSLSAVARSSGRDRFQAAQAKTIAPAQMNTNDRPLSGVKASPSATPMANPVVGPRNCRNPKDDRGMRLAAQAKSTSGTAVNGPQDKSQSVDGRLALRWPAPPGS